MSGSSSKPITVLSIDGGGVRGIIPAVMLQFLEYELQKLEDNHMARLADYFDVISGTSTGGLIATMISASNDEGRPLYPADHIVPFYKEHCPKIFPSSNSGYRNEENKGVSVKTFGPWYDGEYLHQLARDTLGEKRLGDITLANVVIPAYDIKSLSPIVFSTFQVQNGITEFDALLSDICISTSAAPVYLPAYKFSNEGQEFNCIDGGVAANNPTLVAIKEAANNRPVEGDKRIDLKDFQFLVLSLGTGESKVEKYDANMVNNWLISNWLIYVGEDGNLVNPLPEILFDASSDMVDYYCTMFFESSGRPQNFLRVQDTKLPKELSRLDNGSPENLYQLEVYAFNLLKKPMDSGITYGQALREFAQKLYDIKHSQEANTKAKAKAK